MFRLLVFLFVFSTYGLMSPVSAQVEEKPQQTVTLQVENMTCSSCPFTVKMALKQVDGVEKVIAKYEGSSEGWAKVTFDPSIANVKNLINATTNAGYPSSEISLSFVKGN